MSANPSAPLSPGDVTNATRAGWAERSLAEFVKQVYRDPDLPTMGIEDVEDAISDLVCDLRHYALRRGFTSNDLDRMFTNAVAMHKSEMKRRAICLRSFLFTSGNRPILSETGVTASSLLQAPSPSSVGATMIARLFVAMAARS
jgi:hypothetical protein